MTMDLHDLAFHATSGVKPSIDKYVAAGLMPLMVFFGGVYRFYANELRGRTLKDGEAMRGNVDSPQLFVGVVSFVVSMVLFVYVVTNITDPITQEKCPVGAVPDADGDCPISDANKKNDADAVLILTFVWIGYPIVAFASRLFLPTYGFPKTAYVSVFKDIAYAFLDVVSKGGLALYVSYRTTWL